MPINSNQVWSIKSQYINSGDLNGDDFTEFLYRVQDLSAPSVLIAFRSNNDTNAHVSPGYNRHVTVRFVNRVRTRMRVCHIYVDGNDNYLEHELFPWRDFNTTSET